MTEGARVALRRARWELRFRASDLRAYLPIARLRYGEAVVGSETQLVIDGFTRSAVTFSVIGFQLAQSQRVRLAHTVHSSAHVAEAVRRGVPCLVPIRDPDQTALSIVIREPYVRVRQALTAYARFHRHVARVRGGLVIAEFDHVTSDLGAVIDRLNERFGTRFDRFQHTPANVEEVFGIIEDRSRRPAWSRALGDFEDGRIGIQEYRRAKARSVAQAGEPAMAVPEHRVQRPSEVREAQKTSLREGLGSPSMQAERRRAWEAYEELRGS
jgi:hypothetical protein